MERAFTGTVLAARYRVGKLLGRGGTSEVYEGVDETLGRPVAIKILGNAAAMARFEREARLLARLAHPNIIVMSDFHNDAGEPPFIVMERLEGASLGAILAQQGRLPPARVASLTLQMLSALAAAHGKGVVHRDVKPDNVFVCEGADGVVKLLDFGIARPLEGATLEGLTQSNALLGTVSFMAPEQVLGLPVDERTDVYGVGATMYRALAGRSPFDGTAVEVLTAIATRTAPPLEGVDPHLAAIVARAMEREPSARWPTARDMRAALAAHVGGARLAPAPRAPRRGHLGPWIFASTALVVAASLAIAGWTLRGRSRTANSPVPVAAPPTTTAEALATTLAIPSITASPPVPTPSATAPPPPTVRSRTAPTDDPVTVVVNAECASRGDITPKVVRDGMFAHFEDYENCYLQAFHAPYPSGAVVLHVTITDRFPSSVTIDSSDFPNTTFDSCLEHAARRHVIAATSDQTAEAIVTFKFTPKPVAP